MTPRAGARAWRRIRESSIRTVAWWYLEHDLKLEHRLALTNIATSTSNSAVIVWKGNKRPEGGWEYGVELVAPEMDFWGLEL